LVGGRRGSKKVKGGREGGETRMGEWAGGGMQGRERLNARE